MDIIIVYIQLLVRNTLVLLIHELRVLIKVFENSMRLLIFIPRSILMVRVHIAITEPFIRIRLDVPFSRTLRLIVFDVVRVPFFNLRS